MILDIHTHKDAPQPEAVISLYSDVPLADRSQLYSIGIHPWYPDAMAIERLKTLARNPQVVMIGEGGLDTLHIAETPMYRQLQLFRRQIELSEVVRKPLIVHCVRAYQEILSLRRQCHATMPWILHGFRGNPSVAAMFADEDVYFSFGERFNTDTLRSVPEERILAETDDSSLSITDIISRLSEARDCDILTLVARNSGRLLNLNFVG